MAENPDFSVDKYIYASDAYIESLESIDITSTNITVTNLAITNINIVNLTCTGIANLADTNIDTTIGSFDVTGSGDVNINITSTTNIGTSVDNNPINIGTGGNRTVTIGNSTGTGITNVSGVLNLGTDATNNAINIATGGAKTVTVGNAGTTIDHNGTTNLGDTNVDTTGGALDVTGTGTVNLNPNAVLNIGSSANNTAINIATGGNRTVTLGNAGGVTGIDLRGTMDGNSTYKVTGMPNPTLASDAVNKVYADNLATSSHWKASCYVSTTAALAATYTGTPTFTLQANPAAVMPAIDGIAVNIGNRILVQDQAAQTQNGIYTVTQIISPWILTRAADYDDTPLTGEIHGGDISYIERGTIHAGCRLAMTNYAFTTLDVDNITWGYICCGGVQTTKGDLIGFNGLTQQREAVGVDGTVLTASAAAANGITWAAAPVTSVFTRTGAVVAAASDYDAVQVDFTPAVAGDWNGGAPATVKAALDLIAAGNYLTTKGQLLVYDNVLTRPAPLAVGTNTHVLTADSTVAGVGVKWAASSATNAPVTMREEQVSGTEGGASLADSWDTRTLNTSEGNTGLLTAFAASQFTIEAGTYYITGFCPCYKTDESKARLYNVSDTAVTMYGSSAFSDNGDFTTDYSYFQGTFTIAAQKQFQIEQIFDLAVANYGMGRSGNRGTEIYTSITLWKVG